MEDCPPKEGRREGRSNIHCLVGGGKETWKWSLGEKGGGRGERCV